MNTRRRKKMRSMGKIRKTLAILLAACVLCTACGSGSENQQKEVTSEKETSEKESVTTSETVSEKQETTLSDKTTETTENTTANETVSTAENTTEADTEPTTEETKTTENVTVQGKDDDGMTPYEAHGKLSVSGTKLVDKNGNTYQLKGASTHGIAWFPQYVSYDTFKYLRDNFGVNVVRIAMYTAEYAGYCSGGNKEELKDLVKKGVDAATQLGLYVIIDWHILSDSNPQQNKAEAISFFSEMSSLYKNQDNVIYEICNEPNGGTSWADIKSYAMEVIPAIRGNDSDAIIVVGTPTWSQDVDVASFDKITGYDNIMYALHFYAATHKQWIRDKAQTAINNGLALFVTEFSICDASGNGALDINEANIWLDFLNKNGISFVGWSLSNKAESSAMFQSWCGKTTDFEESELSEWAKWLKESIARQ